VTTVFPLFHQACNRPRKGGKAFKDALNIFLARDAGREREGRGEKEGVLGSFCLQLAQCRPNHGGKEEKGEGRGGEGRARASELSQSAFWFTSSAAEGYGGRGGV